MMLVGADDEALYADFLRDTLIAAYASSAADGVLMWGFTDDVHWLHSAPLFKKDWCDVCCVCAALPPESVAVA